MSGREKENSQEWNKNGRERFTHSLKRRAMHGGMIGDVYYNHIKKKLVCRDGGFGVLKKLKKNCSKHPLLNLLLLGFEPINSLQFIPPPLWTLFLSAQNSAPSEIWMSEEAEKKARRKGKRRRVMETYDLPKSIKFRPKALRRRAASESEMWFGLWLHSKEFRCFQGTGSHSTIHKVYVRFAFFATCMFLHVENSGLCSENYFSRLRNLLITKQAFAISL